MSSSFVQGPPGIYAPVSANMKAIFTHRSEAFLSQGRYISPGPSRDPSNTVDIGVLQPGLIMGKIGSVVNSLGTVGQYAPSIYGLTNGAYNGSTSVTLASAAIGTEILRRRGATGTVKLIGPPTAAGVVRTLTATYSAISSVTMTVTALNINEVQTVVNTSANAGLFAINFLDKNGVIQKTQPIARNATTGTIQTACDNALGVNAVTIGGTDATSFTITFAGTGYAALPQTLVSLDWSTDGGALVPPETVTRTTAGQDGRFVTASIIAPTDGSEAPLSFLPDWDAGIKVTDDTGASVSGAVDFPKFPVAGEVDCTQFINFPADASLITWLEQQLSSATGGKYQFAGTSGVF